MTTLNTKAGSGGLPAKAVEGSQGAASESRSEPSVSQRSTALNWDEMMMDYAAIEKRAQEMRAEVAWSIASAVREWAAAKCSQRKAKAAESARTRFQHRHRLT